MIWSILTIVTLLVAFYIERSLRAEIKKHRAANLALEKTIRTLENQLSALADYAAGLEKLKSPESEKSALPSGSASASVPSDRVARGYSLPPGLQPPK